MGNLPLVECFGAMGGRVTIFPLSAPLEATDKNQEEDSDSGKDRADDNPDELTSFETTAWYWCNCCGRSWATT